MLKTTVGFIILFVAALLLLEVGPFIMQEYGKLMEYTYKTLVLSLVVIASDGLRKRTKQ